jgi:restriction system protein
MGHVKNNLSKNSEEVKGLIIALEDDKNLQDALSVTSNVKFMKYRVTFDLVE